MLLQVPTYLLEKTTATTVITVQAILPHPTRGPRHSTIAQVRHPSYGSFTLHGTGTRTRIGGTGKMGLKPIAKFSIPVPVSSPCPPSVQCKHSCTIYRKPFFPVPFPVLVPIPVPCSVNEPLQAGFNSHPEEEEKESDICEGFKCVYNGGL